MTCALHAPGATSYVAVHANHPREFSPAARTAIARLVDAGVPMISQSVLLKGVNDEVATMRRLVRGLLRIKVRPYYLFHCDPVIGAGHFRTSVWKGLELIEGLRGHMSGPGYPDLRRGQSPRRRQDPDDAQLPGVDVR